MKRPPRRSSCAGFTLVEAITATLLMAAILTALATVTAQWLPSWNRGLSRLQRVEIFAAGLERLVADVAAAEYVSAGGVGAPPIFEGSELSVTFVRTAFGPNAGNGLEIVRLVETGTERGTALVRMTAPFAPGSQDSFAGAQRQFTNAVPVIRAPYRVMFSYAGPDRQWHDVWRNAAVLPRAIRVSVRDAATERTLAVSTSMLIHAELPARCVAPRTAAECPMISAAALAASNATDKEAPAGTSAATAGAPSGTPGAPIPFPIPGRSGAVPLPLPVR